MNFPEISRLRNRVMAKAANITVLAGREARVGLLLDIHKEVADALADEGVVLPCHDDKASSDRE